MASYGILFAHDRSIMNLCVWEISSSISKQEADGEFHSIGKIEGGQFSIYQTFAYIDSE